jgi:pimeloyl-ACP methyl ester carboxylesterase
VVREITGADKVNTLGFCVGGTLLASALAIIEDARQVASLTLLATMLDFSDVGEIGVYVDEDYVRQCEETYREGGLMPGGVLASTFASLRANELIWYFVINNYLKGKTPRAFDLLYWNSDGANLPGRLYAWYLRNAYLENNLRVPGKLILCERRLDLGEIRCPAFVLATREDHIVPWRSAYASTQLLAGKIDFVLAASGHIAGIVNPPAAGRRSYWLGKGTPASGDDWLAQAESRPGSWWPHWSAWLKRRSGSRVPAPTAAGSVRYPRSRHPGQLRAEPGSEVLTAVDVSNHNQSRRQHGTAQRTCHRRHGRPRRVNLHQDGGRGYKVTVTYSPGNTKAADWLATMKARGYNFRAYQCDVADFNSCAEAVKKIEADTEPIDVLVNNAGITRDMTFKKMGKADWDAVMRTNLDSVFNMTKQVMDGMVDRGWGRVINSLGERAEGRVWPDELFGCQGGHARFHQGPSTGGSQERRDDKHHFARLHRNQDGDGDPGKHTEREDPAADTTRAPGQARGSGRIDYLPSLDEAAFVTGANISINGGQHMY